MRHTPLIPIGSPAGGLAKSERETKRKSNRKSDRGDYLFSSMTVSTKSTIALLSSRPLRHIKTIFLCPSCRLSDRETSLRES